MEQCRADRGRSTQRLRRSVRADLGQRSQRIGNVTGVLGCHTRGQPMTVQGSITVKPAALNALVSREATKNPFAAAIAAI